MTTHATSHPRSIRTLVLALGLLLASVFASGTASASTLIPLVDMGGPGGGGGAAATLDVAEHHVPDGQVPEILPF